MGRAVIGHHSRPSAITIPQPTATADQAAVPPPLDCDTGAAGGAVRMAAPGVCSLRPLDCDAADAAVRRGEGTLVGKVVGRRVSAARPADDAIAGVKGHGCAAGSIITSICIPTLMPKHMPIQIPMQMRVCLCPSCHGQMAG